jgi:hypothetical protein
MTEDGLESFLNKLGVGVYQKCLPLFQQEDIDMESLKLMKAKDLTDLGVSMGHRVKILHKLASNEQNKQTNKPMKCELSQNEVNTCRQATLPAEVLQSSPTSTKKRKRSSFGGEQKSTLKVIHPRPPPSVVPPNHEYPDIGLEDYHPDGYVPYFDKAYPGLQCVHWDKAVGDPAINSSMVFVVNQFLSAEECSAIISTHYKPGNKEYGCSHVDICMFALQ